ncbi:hypothetical protein BGZ51_000417, partial [Haplosporangium sp. Z 767]
MADQYNLKFFLDSIPEWPSEKAKKQGASGWLRKLSSVTAGQDLVRALLTVETKTTGSMSAWVNRWSLLHGERGTWSMFAKDFVAETDHPRTLQQTLREASRLKQTKGQTTADYMTIVKLTLELIPAQKGCDDKPYKIPEGAASQFAYCFCDGLDPGHPFKRKNKEAPEMIDEAFRQVEELSHSNRWEGVETFESRAIEARQFTATTIVE